MAVSKSILFVAATLLWSTQNASAMPKRSFMEHKSLAKRNNVKFEDCGDKNDPKRIKAGSAWSEAANLASNTIIGNLDDGTAYQSTNAFSNYFDTGDSTIVSSMFGSIQAGSSDDQGNALQLNFIISCKETVACDGSLAVTDADPITDTFTPTLRLCPLFFTDPRTKYLLGDRTFKRDPGRRDDSWCKPGEPFSFFETAGHTFLHEMTHLDQLAAAAGLSQRDTTDPNIKTHGSDDIYAIANGYDQTSPERSARKLKDNWTKYNQDNKNKQPELARVDNAEGFAASATEFWFQQKCGWDSILE